MRARAELIPLKGSGGVKTEHGDEDRGIFFLILSIDLFGPGLKKWIGFSNQEFITSAAESNCILCPAARWQHESRGISQGVGVLGSYETLASDKTKDSTLLAPRLWEIL